MAKRKKGKTMIYKTLHRLRNTNPMKNGVALTAPQVAPLMLLLFQQLIICA